MCTQVKQQTLIPTALEAGTLRSRGGQILCLVGPASWLAGDHLPSVISPVGDTTLVSLQFSSVQLLSRARLSVTPWTAVHQVCLSITNSQSSLKLTSIKSVMPSSHLILCRPFLLPPSIFPSIRVFSNEAALRIRWTKDWCFSFNISPSNEHPGLISFKMDWLHLLAVQGTLKSLLQHHSPKASILWRSAFFIVQLSHPYITTGKTIALTSLDLCWQSNVSAFEYAI